MADTGKAKEEKERVDFDIETKDNKESHILRLIKCFNLKRLSPYVTSHTNVIV